MASTIRVLLYGNDPLLPELRSILDLFDFHVYSAEIFTDLVELLPSATVDLLILAESLPQDEGARTLIFASARWPELKSLRVRTNQLPSIPTLLSQVTKALAGAESRAA